MNEFLPLFRDVWLLYILPLFTFLTLFKWKGKIIQGKIYLVYGVGGSLIVSAILTSVILLIQNANLIQSTSVSWQEMRIALDHLILFVLLIVIVAYGVHKRIQDKISLKVSILLTLAIAVLVAIVTLFILSI